MKTGSGKWGGPACPGGRFVETWAKQRSGYLALVEVVRPGSAQGSGTAELGEGPGMEEGLGPAGLGAVALPGDTRTEPAACEGCTCLNPWGPSPPPCCLHTFTHSITTACRHGFYCPVCRTRYLSPQVGSPAWSVFHWGNCMSRAGLGSSGRNRGRLDQRDFQGGGVRWNWRGPDIRWQEKSFPTHMGS